MTDVLILGVASRDEQWTPDFVAECAKGLVDGEYQLLPPLSTDEFMGLVDSIREKGVQVPIEFDENGSVLDGHHRLMACRLLGITTYPSVVREGMSEAEKRSHARTLNTARRHLNREQRRALIADELYDNPAASNNSIASRLGVSDVTVAAVRRVLGLTSDSVTGADGKTYSVKRQEAAMHQKPTFTYRMVFESADDLEVWHAFLRWARKRCPERTVGCAALDVLVDVIDASE